jgi:hypothetical protein
MEVFDMVGRRYSRHAIRPVGAPNATIATPASRIGDPPRSRDDDVTEIERV